MATTVYMMLSSERTPSVFSSNHLIMEKSRNRTNTEVSNAYVTVHPQTTHNYDDPDFNKKQLSNAVTLTKTLRNSVSDLLTAIDEKQKQNRQNLQKIKIEKEKREIRHRKEFCDSVGKLSENLKSLKDKVEKLKKDEIRHDLDMAGMRLESEMELRYLKKVERDRRKAERERRREERRSRSKSNRKSNPKPSQNILIIPVILQPNPTNNFLTQKLPNQLDMITNWVNNNQNFEKRKHKNKKSKNRKIDKNFKNSKEIFLNTPVSSVDEGIRIREIC